MKKQIIVKEIFDDRDLINDNMLLESNDFDQMLEDDEVDELLREAENEFKDIDNQFESSDIEESALFEDDETDEISNKDNMTDEELKDESLKIAINVAKLMTNVQANDIITIAGTIADFIRNHEIGENDLDSLSPEGETKEANDINDTDDVFNDINAEDNTGSDAEVEENKDNPFASFEEF